MPVRNVRRGTPDSLDDILGPQDASDDGFVEDDDGAGYAAGQVNGFGKRTNTHLDRYDASNKRRAQTWQPQIHESFQPGSTPWRGDRKYLCLNLIGLVWTIEYEQYCTITVEFYDRSFQRDFHFTDPFFYEEACLSEKGILFASHPRPRNNQPAMIYFRPHEHWTTERPDWKISLPKGEDVTAIALSDSFVIISTSTNYVRVYTLYGTPFRIYRQKSTPAVTCASWRDYVLTIGNGPVDGDGRARLLYTIQNIKRDEVCQNEDTVALSADEELKNVFFSDTGDPCIYTTTGLLLVLLHWRTPGQATWVPLLDTTRLSRLASGKREETYWPVAVADGRFHAIILKGGDMHPYFPRPLLSEFDFGIPLASSAKGDDENTNDASKADEDEATATTRVHEQSYLRTSLLHALHLDTLSATHSTSAQRAQLSSQELELDKMLLQMVWECCVGGEASERMGMKALELVGLMRDRSGKMVEGAGRIAGRFGLGVLRGKIEEVAERRLVGLGQGEGMGEA